MPVFLRRVLALFVGVALLLLALELLKRGAAGFGTTLRDLGVRGVAGSLGFGWLFACVVLSGSPVAAIALSLLAAGSLSPRESLAMIVGSRLGASFVVLLLGAIDDLRSKRREQRSAYVGVSAILVTATVYLPAFAIADHALMEGWWRDLQLEGAALKSVVSWFAGPVADLAAQYLPRWVLFVAGVLTLLGALKTFDGALPDVTETKLSKGLAAGAIYRPWVMFVVGLAVTSITMSVSVSISILVPLAAKGYVRRENLFPYMMGANVTTFIDTLFAGALVGHPDAVRIVALLMSTVFTFSLPLVFVIPHRYERLVDGLARRATAHLGALVVFVVLLFALPAALLILSRVAP
ncbi:MAG: hypothetical protein JNJ88_01260 [Planctomycetes bacterium]|nr:hypothetical protein [Planctomycetota bacterium]